MPEFENEENNDIPTIVDDTVDDDANLHADLDMKSIVILFLSIISCFIVLLGAPRDTAEALIPLIFIPSVAYFVFKNKESLIEEIEYTIQSYMAGFVFVLLLLIPLGILYVLAILNKYNISPYTVITIVVIIGIVFFIQKKR